MSYGNPSLKSFKTTFIRRVIVDNIYVWVNKEIIPQAEELLCRAVERGVSYEGRFPHTLKSWDADGDENQLLGLYIEFDTDRDLAGIEDGLGFNYVDDAFVYDRTAHVDLSLLPPLIDEQPTAIGSRQLKFGMNGNDVKFVNLYVGLNIEPDNKSYTKETVDAVGYLQTRLGISVTGEMDWYTWGSILPHKKTRLVGGSAGPKVRALQCGLRCFGYNPPVTSRFGTETLTSLRQWQEEHGLRTTGRAGLEEWNILFDYH